MNPLLLFDGLPGPLVVLFTIAIVIILLNHVHAAIMYVLGTATLRTAPKPDPALTDDYLWIYLVPALNEERVIADSITRLQQVEGTHKLILVINDGSQDNTAAVIAGLNADDVHVLTRTLPDAQKGKAAALNAAYTYINDELLPQPAYRTFPADRVAVTIVDADGRLDAQAPHYFAAWLQHDPHTAMVQSSVRIYNRNHPLTWCQDIEFGVFGNLYQTGRTYLGVAGAGGNAQCNRLTALADVTETDGPWTDTLTEDQDIGLRMINAGWNNRHDVRSHINQQGLAHLGRLYKQRTRWAQGNIQAMKYIRPVTRNSKPLPAKMDLVWTLLQPVAGIYIGTTTTLALVMALLFRVSFLPATATIYWYLLVAFLAFGGTTIGCLSLSRGRPWYYRLLGIAIAIPYAFYSWLLWPVLLRAVWRHLRRQKQWSKTVREVSAPAH